MRHLVLNTNRFDGGVTTKQVMFGKNHDVALYVFDVEEVLDAGHVKLHPASAWFRQLLPSKRNEYRARGWVLSDDLLEMYLH